MRRTVLFFMILGLTTTVAFSQKKEARSVSGFTGINASSVFDITVSKGNTESLTIECEEDVMPYVRSEVRNGILHLYLNNGNKARNINSLRATVVMKNLDAVTLSGACKFTSNDRFTSEKFKCNCSGASNMTVSMNAKQLNLEASGASQIQINANINGNTDLDVSGVSKIYGELKATNVKIDCSGVSVIELKGSANDIQMDLSGTAKILAEDFTVKTAKVESSGASKVTVHVTDHLKVSSSGASSVDYAGSPTVESNCSHAAKVRKI